MEEAVTTGAIGRAKLQSNRHHQQTNTQPFAARMPFLSPNQQCQSTERKPATPIKLHVYHTVPLLFVCWSSTSKTPGQREPLKVVKTEFLQAAGCSCRPTNSVKHWGQNARRDMNRQTAASISTSEWRQARYTGAVVSRLCCCRCVGDGRVKNVADECGNIDRWRRQATDKSMFEQCSVTWSIFGVLLQADHQQSHAHYSSSAWRYA